MDPIDEFLSLMDGLSNAAVDSGLSGLEIVENPPSRLRDQVDRLIDIRMSLLSERDYETVRGYLVIGVLRIDDYNRRVAAFCSVFDLEREIDLKRLKRSCEPYERTQPLFQKIPELGPLVCRSGKRSPDLLDARSFNWDSSGQIVDFRKTKARLHSYLRPELAEWVRSEFSNAPYYFRLHPYDVSPDLKPLLLEVIQRPNNPNWWKKLELWPKQRDVGVYATEDCSPSDNLQQYWDYHVRKIGRLEVHFRRDSSGLLSGLIEEITRPTTDKYIIGRCLHVTSESTVGTDWDAATATHIDGAINVYVDNKEERWKCTLESGKVCDASFRTHLFRIEKVPLKTVLPLSLLFYRSNYLLNEWFDTQFKGLLE